MSRHNPNHLPLRRTLTIGFVASLGLTACGGGPGLRDVSSRESAQVSTAVSADGFQMLRTPIYDGFGHMQVDLNIGNCELPVFTHVTETRNQTGDIVDVADYHMSRYGHNDPNPVATVYFANRADLFQNVLGVEPDNNVAACERASQMFTPQESLLGKILP